MAEKPILFNSEMVRAILDGRKTQTRRVVKPQPDGRLYDPSLNDRSLWEFCGEVFPEDVEQVEWGCPYGRPGDLLWVRETWATVKSYDHLKPSLIPKGDRSWPTVWYMEPRKASASIPVKREIGYEYIGKNRPSIFMPRWASRITLRVTDVRVEHLHEISEFDMNAEGVPSPGGDEGVHHITPFVNLWNSINEERGYGWGSNPWVWVVEFEKV